MTMKNRRTDDPENKTATDLEENNDEQGFDQVEEKVAAWKEEARQLNLIPNANIYKYKNPTGNSQIFVGYFSGDEIPENKHDIGLLYGGGRYHIILRRPKGNDERKLQNIYFEIHSIYDEHKRKHDEENRKNTFQNLPAIVPQAAPTPQETFSVVKDILSLIIPIMAANNRPQVIAPERKETAQEVFNSYSLMQKVLKNQLFDTAQTYKELMQKFSDTTEARQNGNSIEYAEYDDENDQETGKERGVLEKIIDVIEPFFSLIAQKGIAGKIAAAGIKAAPAFNEVLQDQKLCRMIVSYFDQTKGREAADLALQNIGINRAAIFSNQIRTAPQRREPAAPPTAQPAAQTAPQAAQQPQRAPARIAAHTERGKNATRAAHKVTTSLKR